MQFRKLVCEKLAGCLGLKNKCMSTVDKDRDRDRIEISKSASGKLYLHNQIMSDGVRRYLPSKPPALSSPGVESAAAAAAAAARQNSRSEDLLAQIRDLLQAKQLTKARHRHQKEKTQQTASDWILAAAVVDRICFFFIAFFFIGGTLVFVIIAVLATLNSLS